MSSVKMTRLFHEAGHLSIEACRPGTPIESRLRELDLHAQPLPAKNYVSPMATMKLRQIIQENRIRTVFLHTLKDIWLVTPALWGMPHVKLYAFARMFLRGISKKDLGHRLMYSRLDGLIALSHIQEELLQECLPIPPEKYFVVPNGVDTSRFAPRPRQEDLRRHWGFRQEHILFGLIGRLDRQKGSLEFVEAAAHVLSIESNARFVLVGGNTVGESDLQAEVLTLIRERKLEQSVILTDFRSDIPEVMNALDVFVMPSYEENFANVLLEALASGLPSIGTNSGGTPEILDKGETGLLCEPRSSESLAQSMLKLIQDPSLRSTLSKRARDKALQEYAMEKVFERIYALASRRD